MSAPDRVREKLQKILALARQGVGGERENAQSMLNKLLTRYGMTIEELDDTWTMRKTHWFKPKNKHERMLLVQCIEVVLGPKWDRSGWRKPKTREVGYDLTTAEFAEADLMFGVHRRALAKHMKQQERAAINAYFGMNDLFALRDDDEPRGKPLSAEDIAAIRVMMAGMQPTPVHRAITHAPA